MKPKSNARLLVIVIVAVVVLAVIVAAMFSSFSSTTGNTNGTMSDEGFVKVHTGLEYKVVKVTTIESVSDAPLNYYGKPSITSNDISKATNASKYLVVVEYQVRNPDYSTAYIWPDQIFLDLNTTEGKQLNNWDYSDAWFGMYIPDKIDGKKTETVWCLYRVPIGETPTECWYFDLDETDRDTYYPSVRLPLP